MFRSLRISITFGLGFYMILLFCPFGSCYKMYRMNKYDQCGFMLKSLGSIWNKRNIFDRFCGFLIPRMVSDSGYSWLCLITCRIHVVHRQSMVVSWRFHALHVAGIRKTKPYPPIIKCDNGSIFVELPMGKSWKIMENPPLRLRNLCIAMFDHQLWFPWEKRAHVAKERLREPSLLPSSPGRSSTQGAVENILLLCILCGWLCIKMYAYNIIYQ